MNELNHLDAELTAIVLQTTGAAQIARTEVVQSLWSGYGQIVRCHLEDCERASVIVKHVQWPDQQSHPRGWATDRSHLRKLKSYQVETAWYEHYAQQCRRVSPVPECLTVEHRADGILLLLEDLNNAGFAERRHHVGDSEVDACLMWLAGFHATFLNVEPERLWSVGTYWHLATRPDELKALDDGPLKRAAQQLDQRLSDSPFLTFVHGDAKLANFCFSADGTRAAAVDFQYVGGGCGMKDVAYFISSCFDEQECERREEGVLDRYFELLHQALQSAGSSVDGAALEANWRELYPVAWTDFFRFLQGWSPGHWKAHRYSRQLASRVLNEL